MKMQSLLAAATTTALVTASANATLVAYFPLNEGTAGSIADTIDDVIDDPSHGVTDGTANNDNATWVNDPMRGIVLSTVQGNRFTAGTQDIDLASGFTWALWVKSDSVGTTDAGADVIIGSRNGIWNKVQPYGTQRYFDLPYNLVEDQWEHIAYVGDAVDGGKFYIDGVEVASDATPFQNTQTVNDVFEIGGSSRFSEDWTGLMSQIGIWDEVLSPADIASLASGTAPDQLGSPPQIPGDTDNDGDIDDADLGTSFSNYTGPLAPGVGGKDLSTGDTDGDGDVDDADLGTSFSGYTGPLAAAVPEPTSLALIGLGGLLVARRRRA